MRRTSESSESLSQINAGLFWNRMTITVDTYVFRLLIDNGNVGVSAAAGLYQSVLCFITIMVCNKLVKKANPDYALY